MPTPAKEGLNETQLKFVWTIFIVCIFYFVCAGTLTFARFMRLAKKDSPFIVFITNTAVMVQFTVNIFVYFYRSDSYRKAYRDVFNIVFPFLNIDEERQ